MLVNEKVRFYLDADGGGGGGNDGDDKGEQDSAKDADKDVDKGEQDSTKDKDDSNEKISLLTKELKRARDEAAKFRQERKKAATDLESMKALLSKGLGIENSEDATPESLSKELTATRQKLREVQISSAFKSVANALEADPDLTLAYMTYKGMLKDVDPSDEDFEDDLKVLVKKALKENGKLRQTPAAGTKSGAEFSKEKGQKQEVNVNDILRGALGFTTKSND